MRESSSTSPAAACEPQEASARSVVPHCSHPAVECGCIPCALWCLLLCHCVLRAVVLLRLGRRFEDGSAYAHRVKTQTHAAGTTGHDTRCGRDGTAQDNTTEHSAGQRRRGTWALPLWLRCCTAPHA